jgi:hypothetical protein
MKFPISLVAAVRGLEDQATCHVSSSFANRGRQNVIGQMVDELMASIETLPARRAARHNDTAATLRFIHERP